MRKLFFAVVIIAGFASTAATSTFKADISTYIHQEKQYKKIEISEVSKEALDKIKKSYGNYAVKEAYKAEDGEYKLVLTKDGADLTATFTSAGDLIKIIS
ncbi:MAG: hypothetical protein V4581_05055 [Bacteroidota bacterium]